eukprot:Em0008g1077a
MPPSHRTTQRLHLKCRRSKSYVASPVISPRLCQIFRLYLRGQRLAQQAHVRSRAPPSCYESSRAQTAAVSKGARVPQHLQRSRDCTRHHAETQQPQPHRSIPPLYHVPSQRYFPSRVAPPDAFQNQANCHTPTCHTPTLHFPSPTNCGGMPVNYQVRTMHVNDTECAPPNKGATLTASLQTTTYSIALHPLPGVIKQAETATQQAAKGWNGGHITGEHGHITGGHGHITGGHGHITGGHCAEEVQPHGSEEWLLGIDLDPPAPTAAIPKDQCSVSSACSVSEVHTRSRLDTASSNDQNMDTTPSLDHCKKEVMVVPTTACGSLTSVPSSDQKVHMHQQHSEDGVLAKKLPFEDFCTELEVVSSVEKGIFDGGLFVKSEVDPLKVVPPLIFCQWDTDKKGSPCGVPEIGAQCITLDSGSGDDQIIESLLNESSTLEARDNYFASLCKDKLPAETVSNFTSVCRDHVSSETTSPFCLCRDQVPSEATSTFTSSTVPSLCKGQVSSEATSTFTSSTVPLCKGQVSSEATSTFTSSTVSSLSPLSSVTASTIHQNGPLLVKLPLKYYFERSSQTKRVVTQRKRIVRRFHHRGKQMKSLHVRIPLAKLKMPPNAVVKCASAPVFRKAIQVTSCTKIIPLKPSDDSKMELDGYESTANGIDCLSAGQIAQCSSSKTSSATMLLEQWNEVLEQCEQLGFHQREELLGIMTGRIKCDGATDTRRFVLKSLPEGQSVCLEVDLKSRTWSPFKIDASEKQTPLY